MPAVLGRNKRTPELTEVLSKKVSLASHARCKRFVVGMANKPITCGNYTVKRWMFGLVNTPNLGNIVWHRNVMDD